MGVFPDILSRAIKHLCFDFKINQPYNNSEKMKNATFALVLLATALCVFLATPSDAAGHETAEQHETDRGGCVDDKPTWCEKNKDNCSKKKVKGLCSKTCDNC